MIRFLKKSLRAKFTFILFVIGIIPLAASGAFFYVTAKNALFKNVYNELRWNVDKTADTVESIFHSTGDDLILASQNIAFKMYYVDPQRRVYWLSEQKKTLRHLRTLYPDTLDEACYIGNNGREVSRIVLDRIAMEDELESGEERTEFFKRAFELNEGEVFQGTPVISEDTHRWVVPNATPITVEGRKIAILHFEINLEHFQRLLKKSVNPQRGYAFILDEKGRFIANSQMRYSGTEPLPPAYSADTPTELKNIYSRMITGETGIEEFSAGGKDYYISYRPVKHTLTKSRNENRWSIGYVIPSERVYVEASILKYNIMAVFASLILIVVIADVAGKYVTKPIKELSDAASKITAGEMPTIEHRGSDEIGALADAFNLMVGAIKKRDEELRALATRDGLTGLFNYRYFKAELEKEVKSAQRFVKPLSLLMMDMDFFKNYNDTNGHAQGDIALKQLAGIIRDQTREVDTAARYGGEEFAVILPQTPLPEAMRIAQRIRLKVKEAHFDFEEGQPGGDMTISIGAAELSADTANPVSLITKADKALYKAKELGRNRVYAFPS